jgi:hypothetical protein
VSFMSPSHNGHKGSPEAARSSYDLTAAPSHAGSRQIQSRSIVIKLACNVAAATSPTGLGDGRPGSRGKAPVRGCRSRGSLATLDAGLRLPR